MHVPKRFTGTLVAAAAAAIAAGAPAAALAATVPVAASVGPPSRLCPPGLVEDGSLRPLGPYAPNGAWGDGGTLHGARTPLVGAATCSGVMTYVVPGSTPPAFIPALGH